MTKTPGITPQSTRPTRRQAREQATSLAAVVAPVSSPDPVPTPPALQVEPEPTAPTKPATEPKTPRKPAVAPSDGGAGKRLTAPKRTPKVPFSTQIEIGTARRLDWLVRERRYKLTDITGDALDELFDKLGVPTADDLA